MANHPDWFFDQLHNAGITRMPGENDTSLRDRMARRSLRETLHKLGIKAAREGQNTVVVNGQTYTIIEEYASTTIGLKIEPINVLGRFEVVEEL